MPYKCEGNKLLYKKDGVWTVKQVCKDHTNCVKAMGLLYAIEKNPDYAKKS